LANIWDINFNKQNHIKMRTKFLILSAFTFLLLLSCESTSLDEPIQIEESVTLSKAPSVNNSYVVISSSNKLPKGIKKSISSINGSISNSIPEIGIIVAHSEDPDFISNASKLKGVQSVIPNYEIQWIDPEMQIEMVEVSSINPPNTGDDDFVFDLQWGHDAIDAPEAWETGARGKGVMVFVLDSGIDAEHLDISPNLNSELSKSFVAGEHWNVRDEPVFNHGTHVAGTIAGADNGWGIIGVAPEATIVAVKVLSEYNGSGLFSWIIEGIIYASDSGADIINMSLGGLNCNYLCLSKRSNCYCCGWKRWL
jgi:subtilisin family serine protease